MNFYEITIGGQKYVVTAASREQALQIVQKLFPQKMSTDFEGKNIEAAPDYDADSLRQITTPEITVPEERRLDANTQIDDLIQFGEGQQIEEDAYKELMTRVQQGFQRPETRFRQTFLPTMGDSGLGTGIIESLSRTLAPTAFANFLANTALGGFGSPTGGAMEGYTPQTYESFIQGTPNIYQQAGTTFQNLINRAGQGTAGLDSLNPLSQFINPTPTEGLGLTQNRLAGQAAQLARAAARNRFGGLFAQHALPNTGALLRGYDESPGFGTEGGGFLPYLQRTLGLG